MKTVHRLAILGSIICVFGAVIAFASCSKLQNLSAPTNLSLDEATLELTWDAVPNAVGYVVAVGGESEKVEEAAYSFDGLDAGDYTVKVKAVGDGEAYSDSAWSAAYPFTIEEEVGLSLTLIERDTAYEVTGLGTMSGDIVIPDTYRGKPVVSIAAVAFSNKSSLTGVVMGDNIVSIGAQAFYNCSYLTKVTFGANVESIGAYAFQSCRSLTEVVLPDGVTEILGYTFSYCRSLERVTFGKNVTTIELSAFANCDLLKEINIPDTVTSVGESAFSGCTSAESITIGNGVVSLGDSAFYQCTSVTSVSIGSSLTSISKSAFSWCTSLTSIDLSSPALTSIGASAFYKASSLSEVSIGDNVTEVGLYAFLETALWEDAVQAQEALVYADKWLVGCTDDTIVSASLQADIVGIAAYAFVSVTTQEGVAIESVVIPDSVRYVNRGAFYHCASLQYVTVGSGVEEIGQYAFAQCPYLETVIFRGENLTSIANFAFAGSDSVPNLRLNNVKIPQGVESIGNYAFYYCTALDNISIADSVTTIRENAFYGTALWNNSTTDIVYADNWVVGYIGGNAYFADETIIDGTVGIADYAFKEASVTKVYIPESVTLVGTGIFYSCTSLTYAGAQDGSGLPESITVIQPYMFYGCTALSSVVIPDHVTEIGEYAFASCEALVSVSMGNGLETIRSFAFYSCTALSEIDFGETVKTIEEYAFYSCSALAALTVPDSVTSMGKYAFALCSGLGSVTFGSGMKEIPEGMLAYAVMLGRVVVPAHITSIGDFAFYYCSYLTDVELENGVRTIGTQAFGKCYSLQNLVLPASVETIGEYAFHLCINLTSLIIPNSVKSVGDYAFYGCSVLTLYCEAENASQWSDRANATYRPVVWGCTLSAGGDYVQSVTVGASTFSYFNQSNTASAPFRKGYTFAGWTTEDSSATYSAEDVHNAPEGTVLYAVWTETVEDAEEGQGE